MTGESFLNIRDLDRFTLRLSAKIFAAIDRARSSRPGHVSRNTWVSEAVQEKLAREAVNQSQPEVRHHG